MPDLKLTLILLLFPLAVIFITRLFQWLWNTTMPELFHLKEVTFWQALKLLLIAAFLFGSGSIVQFSIGG